MLDELLQYTPQQLREQGFSEAVVGEVQIVRRELAALVEAEQELANSMDEFTDVF